VGTQVNGLSVILRPFGVETIKAEAATSIKQERRKELSTQTRVCTARPGPIARLAPGTTDNVRVQAGFRPGSNHTNQTLYQDLSGNSFFFFASESRQLIRAKAAEVLTPFCYIR
jgi:hypothetical protein